MVTDQPITPNIPRPNQMLLCFPDCAFSLRLAFFPIWRLTRSASDSVWRCSPMLELQESSHESAFQFCQHRPHSPLALVKILKLLLNCRAQLPQVRANNG